MAQSILPDIMSGIFSEEQPEKGTRDFFSKAFSVAFYRRLCQSLPLTHTEDTYPQSQLELMWLALSLQHHAGRTLQHLQLLLPLFPEDSLESAQQYTNHHCFGPLTDFTSLHTIVIDTHVLFDSGIRHRSLGTQLPRSVRNVLFFIGDQEDTGVEEIQEQEQDLKSEDQESAEIDAMTTTQVMLARLVQDLERAQLPNLHRLEHSYSFGFLDALFSFPLTV